MNKKLWESNIAIESHPNFDGIYLEKRQGLAHGATSLVYRRVVSDKLLEVLRLNTCPFQRGWPPRVFSLPPVQDWLFTTQVWGL